MIELPEDLVQEFINLAYSKGEEHLAKGAEDARFNAPAFSCAWVIGGLSDKGFAVPEVLIQRLLDFYEGDESFDAQAVRAQIEIAKKSAADVQPTCLTLSKTGREDE
ncbi:MAG: hypothetical protein Q4G30_07555 [Actinomycetaceae bacterium]|nr:hypothetical protein [Actinomycetaceae bacterium]